MSTTRHARLAELFAVASALEGSARASYLDGACAGDLAVRAEVERLLAHAPVAARLFATGGADAAAGNGVGATLSLPASVGDYELFDVLGEGGMAIVYRARQRAPSREVALKMIKQGMDTQQVVARFESEREALAAMDHPHIARVYDAGASSEGRPYFVMERVDGVAIGAYCAAQRLDVRERVALMLAVCRAVEHAHQRGVIHRDLKPSNILIATQDGRPAPKVIDFGIAKSIASGLSDGRDVTRHGQVLGTLDYMSPEQAHSPHAGLDTRTDVYALGVVLYELLTGELPLTAGTQPELSFDEIRLRIDPQRPSVRLARLPSDVLQARALARATRPEALVQQLRRDLDWIALKALEKDRERRYQTASALAEDLERYLRAQPVAAHPPSARYVLGRFVRRNRLAVAAAATVALALLIGVIGLSIGVTRALRSERLARGAEQAASAQAERAGREAARAQAVSDFLVQLFELADPGRTQGDTITARAVLDRGAERIDRELSDQPLVQAALLDTMAQVYMNLGLYADAAPLADRALALRETQLGKQDAQYAQSLRTRGLVHYWAGEYGAAEAAHRAALAVNEALYGADSLVVAENLHNVATAVFEQSRLDQAQSLFERSLALRRRRLPAAHEDTATSLNSLASVLRRQGHYEQARALYEEALDMRMALQQAHHPDTAVVLSNLGVTFADLKDYARAETTLRRALALQRELYGDRHPMIGTVLSNLGAALAAQGKLAETEAVFVQSLAFHRALYGAMHPNTANVLTNLGAFLHWQGRDEESEAFLREAVGIFEQPSVQAHPIHGIALANLAMVRLARGDAHEAAALATDGAARISAAVPAGHPWIAVANSSLGAALAALGESARATALLSESVPVLEQALGATNPRTLEAKRYLAGLLSADGGS